MDCAINQLGRMECDYIDRLRRIAPLLSDKEILDSVAANTTNVANMGKTMQSEGASNLGILNQPVTQAPTAQDFAQFMEPEPQAPTAQDFAQFMEPMEPMEPEPQAPTAQDFSQFMEPMAPVHKPTAKDFSQFMESKNKLLVDLMHKVSSSRYKIKDGVVDEVRNLLNSGANPNIKDKYGRPVLHMSVDYTFNARNQEIVRLLLKAGADPNIYDISLDKDRDRKRDIFSNIFGSLRETDVEMLRLLLESGADPNLPSYWQSKSSYPIHQMLDREYSGEIPGFDNFDNIDEYKEKKLEGLRLLLESGADPTKKDVDGKNALELARYNYDTYHPQFGHFLEEVQLIEEHMERVNRKKSGKVFVKEGKVFTQAGLGRRRPHKKKKLKKKKGGKTLKKKKKTKKKKRRKFM